MLWLLTSAFFIWLIYREFRLRRVPRRGYDAPLDTPVSKPYLAALLLLAMAFGWPPFKAWRLERLLEAQARVLVGGRPVEVHCGTFFDSVFDNNSMSAGHADTERGRMVFVTPWCDRLHAYIARPAKATEQQIIALHIFTHESMHLRGELDEARTECQAIQRNHHSAMLLGVPESLARQHALRFYRDIYQRRKDSGPFSSHYYSAECAPGKAMDEQLPGAPWLGG